MILGLGLDLVELSRIEEVHRRHGETFVRRFCRPGEAAERSGAALIQHLGGLFAAKEAVLKALGTGWAQGLGLRQVEVERLPSGAPRVILHDAAAERARRLGVKRTLITITHERTHAAAVAVLEGDGPVEEEPGEPRAGSGRGVVEDG